jgi:hypothetical protein
MTKEQDLSKFAAFDLDELISEIETSHDQKQEVTAYLDRSFVIKMIKKYHEEALTNKPDFTAGGRIDFTDYNFTGADFRRITREDLELCNFSNCDITEVHLDRIGLEFFREYILEGNIIYQGLNLEGAYLGPTVTKITELGIDCTMTLNLSNLNLTGSNFCNSNIQELILEKTNIAGCDFTDVKNLSPQQFAFTLGFETAIFNKDKQKDQEIKAKIKQYSNSLDPEVYYARTVTNDTNSFTHTLKNLFNFIDN